MKCDSAKVRDFLRCAACLPLIALCKPAVAQDASLYTVAKLSVSMTAKDAVTAKKKALVLAKRRALDTVFRRITPFNSADRLPVVKGSVIEGMLDGISVRRERNSATRYLATLDFTFSAGAVRKVLGGKGFTITDQQAGPISVLPVYIDKGKINHTGRDPWRNAWNALDLNHALVPVRLSRAGPSFTMDALANLLGGDVEAFVALRDKQKTGKLVVAIAELTADGQKLTTRLFGVDRVGSVSLSRNDPVFAKDIKSAANRASQVMLGVIEGRWKLAHSTAGGSGEDATPASIGVVVEFNGMRQWRDIRARLIKVPGVNGFDVKSLSARTAQVAFQFPGGAERLARSLTPHGLSLHGGGGSLILRSN